MFWNFASKYIKKSSKLINRKHEMFWNENFFASPGLLPKINRKHEMFWNM